MSVDILQFSLLLVCQTNKHLFFQDFQNNVKLLELFVLLCSANAAHYYIYIYICNTHPQAKKREKRRYRKKNRKRIRKKEKII